MTYKGRALLLRATHQLHPWNPPLNLPPLQMSTYYVPTTPPARGRGYSLSQPGYPYPATPYSGYNTLAPSYGMPGMSRSATYYVTPSVAGRTRSHSRPRHSSSHHHRSHHHGHRRSHSARPHRPSAYVRVFPMGDIKPCLLTRNFQNHSYRPQPGASYVRNSTYRQSPSLGERILSFFGLGNSNRYVDQYGRSVDNRGRSKHKY
jgi:hypothetical protein